MSNDIQVGDVCEIFDACCAGARAMVVGVECVVVGSFSHDWQCKHCGYKGVDILRIEAPLLSAAPRQYLRKKPPKQLDDAEPRLEHVPAEPEFVEQLRRQLTKEPA